MIYEGGDQENIFPIQQRCEEKDPYEKAKTWIFFPLSLGMLNCYNWGFGHYVSLTTTV